MLALVVGRDDADPLVQYHPPAHSPVGADRPAMPQYDPAVQSWQSARLAPPVALLYVPAGHRCCDPLAVPAGQYDPGGHGFPSNAVAFAAQKKPAGHTSQLLCICCAAYVPDAHPFGSVLCCGQYWPSGHTSPYTPVGVAVFDPPRQ